MKGPITCLGCSVPVGGPPYQQDTRTVFYRAKVTVVGRAVPSLPYMSDICRRTNWPPRPTQSFSKLTRSTLHPVIITVPNRRRICVVGPPRQLEAAVQFPLLLWPSHPLPSPAHSGTVCLSSRAEALLVFIVCCVVSSGCAKRPPPPPATSPHHLDCLQENTQRGDGGGFLPTKTHAAHLNYCYG